MFMYLTNRNTGRQVEARILEVHTDDFSEIKNNRDFSFNWETETDYEVYKLFVLSERDNILGLMSLIDRPDEYRIHLNLLEVVKSQRGKEKKLDHIAGCLIAFAASLAIKKGYNGFVSLEPKTRLIDYYQEKYGFRQYGRYLAIEGAYSIDLVNKYLIYE